MFFPHCLFIFASDGLVTCGQLKTVSLCKMDFSPSNKNIDHRETLCDITLFICVSAEINLCETMLNLYNFVSCILIKCDLSDHLLLNYHLF